MTIFTVLGLDLGQTSGWGRYRAEHMIDPDGEHEWYQEQWTCGKLGPEPHHEKLEALLELQESAEYHIVCESFEFRQQDGAELISRDYIGVTTLTAKKYGWPVHMQTASQGKIKKNSFVREKNLKRLGLWVPGKEWRHSMDGYGHILFWLINGEYRRRDILAKGWPNE